ncbi:hypothetical protein PVAP13_8NG181600 [Panicum virgatum]|uniref:Auxin-responsive protein n=1 Tax=Panicum virgatum TaxID=38727 RepID=A0A8T0PA09_PANVG|nr:hypothetical protein PVAP13_8NG181600 [Panicum virgatum]
MMNLVSFETPPLGRKERANTTITAKAPPRANESNSSSTCFHSHLDLSLGISLSHGGSSCCDATGCSGIKASCGGRQGGGGDKNLGCMTSGTITTTTNALTAGHDCHVSDSIARGGWAAAFMLSPTGFMHPWSLAARQQKAAAEQKLTPPTTYVPSSDARVVPLSSAIGWPPVHTSRRNIVTSMHVTKEGGATVTADELKGSTTTHAGGKINAAAPPTDSTVIATRPPANMFAKVHMDGCTIGRKINLRAHGSYESLSRVLTRMTRNFFCPDCSGSNTGEEDLPNSDKFIFLYEDFEGDRMLVGDVPWELFLASAKRLYIVQNPTSGDKGDGECGGKGKTEEPPINN